MNQNEILRHSPDAAWRRIDGLVAIVSLGANRVRLLNRVGSFLWERCDGRPTHALVHDLTEHFEVSEEQARQDLGAFIVDLEARGLITRGEERG